MKIALINLNRYNNGDTPPLNLISIATYLNKHLNFCDIKIFDVNFDDVVLSVKLFEPDLIGFSAMTVDYALAIEISKKIGVLIECDKGREGHKQSSPDSIPIRNMKQISIE